MQVVDEFLVKVGSIGGFTEEELGKFCSKNDHLRIERDSEGNLLLKPPAYTIVGYQNANLGYAFAKWNEKFEKGICYGSSAGFILPNTAMRSPDFSFILHETLNKLTAAQKKGFYKVCPDFVLELRSATDLQETLRDKMKEYLQNGATLGWLIDPIDKVVVIYDKDGSITEFKDLDKPLQGKYFLSDFEIILAPILK